VREIAREGGGGREERKRGERRDREGEERERGGERRERGRERQTARQRERETERRERGRGEHLSAKCDALDKLVRDGLVSVVGVARVLARGLLQQRVASVSVASVSVLLYQQLRQYLHFCTSQPGAWPSARGRCNGARRRHDNGNRRGSAAKTPAYVSRRQQASAYFCIRQHRKPPRFGSENSCFRAFHLVSLCTFVLGKQVSRALFVIFVPRG
jgi:hypothetical protein